MKKNCLNFNKIFASLFMPFFCFVFFFLIGFNISQNIESKHIATAQASSSVYTQEYLDYLSASPEVKEKYHLIPRMYEVDSQALYTAPSYLSSEDSLSLPSGYMLYNDNKVSTILKSMSSSDSENCDNLPLNVGNQNQTGICWSFASLTAFETSLYKAGVVQKSENLNFSELDMAYVTQVKNYGEYSIGGGSFELACEYIMSEMGPVYEQPNETLYPATNWKNDYTAGNYYANNFYGKTTKANYTALETYYFPSTDILDAQGKLELRNSIKNHIRNYGGVTASIYMDSSRVTNSQTYMYTFSGSSALVQNHLVTLVGWNDNITYVSGGTTYKGAYIVQNSYGTVEFGINGLFYIMYDDMYIEDNVAGFVRVGETLSDTIIYDSLDNTSNKNKFLEKNAQGYGYTLLSYTGEVYFANLFEREDVEKQYISKILVPTVSDNSLEDELNFYVYVIDGLSSQDVTTHENIQSCLNTNFNISGSPSSNVKKVINKYAKTDDEYLFKAKQAVYYSIELSEKIDITSDYFAIILQVISGPVYFKANVDDSLLSKQITYANLGVGWDYNYYDDKCILPMQVQTQYDLGQIEYTSSGVSQVYSSTDYKISVNVQNLSVGNYTIYYSLDTGVEKTWSTNPILKKDAGEYTVYFKIVSNYCLTIYDSETIIISPKKMIILPYTGQGKIYGNADGIINYNYFDNYEIPKFSGKLSRIPGEDVGQYKITLGNLTLIDNILNGVKHFNSNNYYLELSPTIVKYEVRQRPLYVESESVSKVYGELDPVKLNYTYSNYVEEPAFSGELSRVSGEDAAKYEILKNTLALIDNAESSFKASNYELVYNENDNLTKFEITKRPIIITPKQGQSKVYLSDDFPLEFSFSNVLDGQLPKFGGYLSRETGEDVGEYQILLGSLVIAQDNGSFLKNNYKLCLDENPVYFTINYGELEGCEVENITANYDTSNFSPNPINTKFDNVKITYSFDNEVWQTEKPNFKNVGEYLVYVKFEKTNYASVVKQVSIKINSIDLTIVPHQNQNKTYGEKDDILTYDFSGVLAGEIASFDGSLSRKVGEDVGSYLIEQGSLKLVDNKTFVSANYNLVFDNSLLACYEIVKRDLIVTPTINQNKIYGKDEPIIEFVFENTLESEVPVYSGSLSRETGENVGSYKINLGSLELQNKDNFKSSNYNLILSETDVMFEITKADLVLTINNEYSYYGDPVVTNFSCEYSSDYVLGDELNIVYYCEVNEGTRKGTYTISATAENENYNIEIVPGIYEVKYYSYQVNFILLNNTIGTTQVEHFSLVNPENIPQVELLGYTFNYWKVMSADTSYKKVDLTKYQIIKSIDLVADMELIDYEITLVTNNQNKDMLINTYTITDDTFSLEIPQNKGYTFLGWYENEDFSSEQITEIETGSYGNKTFFAKWQINIYNVSFEYDNTMLELTYTDSLTKEYNSSFEFSIEFFEEYSQSISSVKAYFQNSLNLGVNNPIEAKETEENKITFVVKNIEDNIKIIFDGISINTYTIDFIIDNEIVKSISKEYGESLISEDYPEIPSKVNFDNISPIWDLEELNDIKQNYEVKAIYTPNIYEVKFIVNNGTEYKTSVTYGEEVDVSGLKEACDLNMFEYFIFDSSLKGISENTTINVKIESSIYILYIVLGVVGFVIVFTTVALVIKHKKRSKFKWWNYTSQK